MVKQAPEERLKAVRFCPPAPNLNLRVYHNGSERACQARYVGPIPITRSTIKLSANLPSISEAV